MYLFCYVNKVITIKQIKKMRIVTNSYPNCSNIRISEVFKPNQGWVNIWGVNLVDLTPNNILKAKNEGATMINVYLVDEFGVERYPDYSVKELVSSFAQKN